MGRARSRCNSTSSFPGRRARKKASSSIREPPRIKKRSTLAESQHQPGKRIYLDLGAVRDVAEVRLNGKSLGVLWTAPWHMDITDVVKAQAKIAWKSP